MLSLSLEMWNVLVMILACTVLAESVWAEDPETGEAESAQPRASETGEEEEAEPEKELPTVNLIFQGTDPDLWNLDVGGGWNENDGAYGRLALRSTNFLGRGEVFKAAIELGDEHELYELEYRRPFLFGRRQSLGVRLFKDATDHPVAGQADFDQRRVGATLAYGRRFGASQRFELEYRFADVDQRESAFGAGGELLSRRSVYASSSLRPSWVYDRLDDRVPPKGGKRNIGPLRGLRLAASLEAAGGVLGGESELLKAGFGVTWFKPVSGRPLRSTFGVRTRLGWIEATGGELFAQQRYFLGGEDSVRGFRRHSIAALEDDGSLARDADGFPLGGEKLVQLNLEYHLLLGERFRLVWFADAGGVFARGQRLASGGLRSSAGAELRVTLPKLGVPLRLIYAHNLDPLPGDRFRDLSVSVGVSF